MKQPALFDQGARTGDLPLFTGKAQAPQESPRKPAPSQPDQGLPLFTGEAPRIPAWPDEPPAVSIDLRNPTTAEALRQAHEKERKAHAKE